MGKVKWFFALVAAISLLLVGSLAWAQKTPAGFGKGQQKGFTANPNVTGGMAPRGWNSQNPKGRTIPRKGWTSESGPQSLPPGLGGYKPLGGKK